MATGTIKTNADLHADIAEVQNDVSAITPTSGTWTNNGWLRLPEGTQICWKYIESDNVAFSNAWGSMYETASALPFGDWPRAFIDAPYVVTAPTRNAAIMERIQGISASSAGSSFFMRPVSGAANIGLYIIAIGRWK